jgi:adenosylmethionine-8-amino-7-oxononanoate aminotransferase
VTDPNTVPARAADPDHDRLQELGRRHLWMHFTRMGALQRKEFPVIASGEGCYVRDTAGRRYLDGLSGLFVTQVGYGRAELAQVAAKQAETLHYFPVWGYGHGPAVELAATLAELAPGDLNRVFLTGSGSESVETALKLARQYFKLTGEPGRYKVISRATAYHGVTMGALAITGVPQLREPFEPLPGGFHHVPNTNQFRPFIPGLSRTDLTDALLAVLDNTIRTEGPETIAAVFLEPLQNAGGCIPPPPGYFAGVRELCDRYGVLLVSDEVICAYGRLGTMFGCERYGYLPDMVTTAKGLTSGYSPLGAVLCSDRLMAPFLESATAQFNHGITFGGHPVSCAVALENLRIFERESIVDHVAAHSDRFGALLEDLRDIPVVGDVRGDGYFRAIELVPPGAPPGADGTPPRFERSAIEPLLRGFVFPRMLELGLIARVDDRGDPVVQFAPTLVCGEEQLVELAGVVRQVLTEATDVAHSLA